MFGLTASTWNVVGIILGLAGVLLLFRYGMPGRVETGGRPMIVANATREDEAEERKYKWLGYLGLGFTIAGAICGGIGAYS